VIGFFHNQHGQDVSQRDTGDEQGMLLYELRGRNRDWRQGKRDCERCQNYYGEPEDIPKQQWIKQLLLNKPGIGHMPNVCVPEFHNPLSLSFRFTGRSGHKFIPEYRNAFPFLRKS
jgi:hypothetical protein